MESCLLALYIAIGQIAWVLYGYMIFLGRRKMQLMRRPPLQVNVPLPLVTVIVPAKDEGERIRACLNSALAQDYSNYKVVAIDDRSVDQTGAIMDEIAAADSRLTVLHNTRPPAPGWTGKNNALHTAAEDAPGEWMLFVDSDVVLEKDALSAAMAVVLRKKFDLLSLLPRLESHTLWESVVVPLAGAAASSLYLIALTNNSQVTSNAFANGQFMLINRSSYDAIGGHVTVRDRFCEDVEIARLLKTQGFRPRFVGKRFCRRADVQFAERNHQRVGANFLFRARGKPVDDSDGDSLPRFLLFHGLRRAGVGDLSRVSSIGVDLSHQFQLRLARRIAQSSDADVLAARRRLCLERQFSAQRVPLSDWRDAPDGHFPPSLAHVHHEKSRVARNGLFSRHGGGPDEQIVCFGAHPRRGRQSALVLRNLDSR